MYQLNSKSLKPGDTAALRRFVAAVLADNGVPNSADDQHAAVGLYETIDVQADCAVAGGSFKVTVWWWYNASGKWVADANLTAVPVTNATGSMVAIARPKAATAIYVQVHTFAGAGATADVWLTGR